MKEFVVRVNMGINQNDAFICLTFENIVTPGLYANSTSSNCKIGLLNFSASGNFSTKTVSFSTAVNSGLKDQISHEMVMK